MPTATEASSSSSSTSHSFPLPPNLPEPIDDGQALHLIGHPLPPLLDLASTSTSTPTIDLFALSLEKPVLLFLYPRTGATDGSFPPKAEGSCSPLSSWDQVPGARGCTPHLVSVKEVYSRLLEREKKNTGQELQVFGMSLRSIEEGREVRERLKLPFPLLSDSPSFQFTSSLSLPTFTFDNQRYLKRMTMLLRGGQIVRIDYPVFPSDQAGVRGLEMLKRDDEE